MASKKSIPDTAHRALKKAVKDLVKERRASNDKLVVWKNGRVMRISARKV